MTSTLARCPQCGTPVEYRTDNPARPFCSPRCKLIDLGAWAEARYAIAGPGGLPEQSATADGEDSRREPASPVPRSDDN